MEGEKPVEVILVEDNSDDFEFTEFAMLQATDNLSFRHFTDGVEALNLLFGKKEYEGMKL